MTPSSGTCALDLRPKPAAPRPMDAQECWDQLRRQHEGRLGYLSGRGPRHVVRPFAVVDRAVLVRLPGYDDGAGCVDGQRVCFDVQEQGADGLVAAVEATGRARVVDGPPSELAGLPDEGWPAGRARRVVSIELDDVRGTRRPVGPGRPAGAR